MTDDDTQTPRDGSADVSVDEMIGNMGEPEAEIPCPIDGCDYSHRSAQSVAGHVSARSTRTHIWSNTSYDGWRDFVHEHGEAER